MAAEIVTSTLKDMGAAGAAISVLMTVVGALAGAVVIQYRQANKVYGYRLAERDTLNKALTDSAAAINSITKVSDERNDITAEFADVIAKQTIGLDHIKQQFEEARNDIRKQSEVVGALSEAVRVNSGIVTDTRNWIQQLPRSRR